METMTDSGQKIRRMTTGNPEYDAMIPLLSPNPKESPLLQLARVIVSGALPTMGAKVPVFKPPVEKTITLDQYMRALNDLKVNRKYGDMEPMQNQLRLVLNEAIKQVGWTPGQMKSPTDPSVVKGVINAKSVDTMPNLLSKPNF